MTSCSDRMIELEYQEWLADPEAVEERWAAERQQAEHDADMADWQRWEDEQQESAAP